MRKQGALRAEADQLTKQADRLCTPATFAQSTKLRRKALASEKEAAELAAKQVPGCSLPHAGVPWEAACAVGHAANFARCRRRPSWLRGRTGRPHT